MSTPNDQDREPAISPATDIVLIVAGGALADILVNYFAAHFGSITILKEEPESKRAILRRRTRLLGVMSAYGQAVAGLVFRVLGRMSAKRIDEICAENGLDRNATAKIQLRQVGSVNSEDCRKALRELRPAVVAVYGTRIIGKATLNCIRAPFINYHAGINPMYRGQHPGYWAMVNNDPANVGVTIHLVDDGVDTGGVLAQSRVVFDPRDNITTYQYVQMASALPLFTAAVDEALAGRHLPSHVDLPSQQWFPPTIWAYLWKGLRMRVW